MVWSRFRRYAHPALFRIANDRNGAARRNVTEVDVPARQLRQQHVARDHDLFRGGRNALQAQPSGDEALVHDAARRKCRILAVVGDGDVERARVLEGGAHEMTRHDRFAIIGDGDGAGSNHFAELGEPLPSLADGNGADRMHARQAGAPRLTDDESDGRLVVGHGIGIRHRADGSEPTRGGRPSAARHRLLVFIARFAQMYMEIDQTGRDHFASHVANKCAVRRL